MSINSQIGASAVVIIDGVDISRYCKTNRMTALLQAIDDTRFRSTNFAREFVAGLRGGAIGISGSMPTDEDGNIPDPTGTWANPRSAHDIYVAPNGATPGYLVRMGKSVQSAFSAGADAPDAIYSFTADFEKTIGSPGVLPGISLETPHGSGTISSNEEQLLTFNAAPTVQEFALRAVGTSEVFVFTPATSNANIKAGIEGLAAYAGQTVTVTGSLTGTDTKSGTRTITFSGAVDVPALEVRNSESELLTMTSVTGSGTWRGATITPGDSEGTVQTALQGQGGVNANVVVKGSSTSNAGTNEVQRLTWDGEIGDGTLTYAGQTTGNIAPYVSGAGTAAAIQSALEALSNIAPGDVAVTVASGGTSTDGPWDVEFTGTLAGTNVSQMTWAITSGSPGPGVTVSTVTPGAPGVNSGSYTAYFPYTEGNVTAGAVTGTGYVRSTPTQGGSASALVVATTTTAGDSDTNLNVLSATGNGTTQRDIALTATTNQGAVLVMQAIASSGASKSVTVVVEHAPNNAGSPGTWATLGTFEAQTTNGAQTVQVAAGTTINPFVRYKRTAITGDWALAIGFARRYG